MADSSPVKFKPLSVGVFSNGDNIFTYYFAPVKIPTDKSHPAGSLKDWSIPTDKYIEVYLNNEATTNLPGVRNRFIFLFAQEPLRSFQQKIQATFKATGKNCEPRTCR